MHQAAASLYARTAKITQSPRELEASLLQKAAYRLQAISDDWAARQTDLAAALTFNRRIWTILATSATTEENPLPAPIKANIAQLAAFIFQRTLAVLADPAPERIRILVNINREIATGLRSAAATTPLAAAAG